MDVRDVKYNVHNTSPDQDLIWVTAAVEEAVLRAGVGAWRCSLWSHHCTGIPHIGICSQTWTAGTAAPPARSEVSSAFQKCPGTRSTGLPLQHRAHLCPSCRLWSVESSPGGGEGPERGECQRRDPEFVQRRKTGTAAGRGSSRTC